MAVADFLQSAFDAWLTADDAAHRGLGPRASETLLTALDRFLAATGPEVSVDIKQVVQRTRLAAAEYLEQLGVADPAQVEFESDRLGWFVGDAPDLDLVGPSSVRMLLARAQSLSRRTREVAANEVELAASWRRLDDAQIRLSQLEDVVTRRIVLQADSNLLRAQIAQLRSTNARLAMRAETVAELFRRTRRAAREAALTARRNKADLKGFEALMTSFAYTHLDAGAISKIIHGMRAARRSAPATRLADLSSDQVLCRLCEAWIAEGGYRIRVEMALEEMQRVLEELWQLGEGPNSFQKMVHETQAGGNRLLFPESSFARWSARVRSQFGS
jgi:hypothetical protein